MEEKTGGVSELALLVSARLIELGARKSQKEVAEQAGFPSPNMITLIKSGASKLSLDRVPAMAKALELDLVVVMMAALKQYYSDETISALRLSFSSAETEAERDILAIARKSLKNPAALSYETRTKLAEVMSKNKPAGR